MLKQQIKKLLPFKQASIRSKSLAFIPKLSITTKVVTGVLLTLSLLGYQPTLAIPPIKKSIVKAEVTQEQVINASSFSKPFILPHPGYLTTHYSKGHPGIDLAAGLGMPIHPINDGKVIEVAYGFLGLGHYVVIEHQYGIRSTYAHMGRIYVKKDTLVTTASTLGNVGMTGHTSGPHTHLEITRDGKYIDPLTILPAILDNSTKLATR